MGELGHMTWLSAKMVVKLPDLSQNGGSHVLYEKSHNFLSCKDFKLNERDLKA